MRRRIIAAIITAGALGGIAVPALATAAPASAAVVAAAPQSLYYHC